MVSLFATGCATGGDKMAQITEHFNNPPPRYCTPIAGKEAEAEALDKKLAKIEVTNIVELAKIVAQRAILLEGRCKRLNPSQYGAVCTATAVTIDGVGVVMEDLTFRSSSIGKAYINVYNKSEALKLASQQMNESGADAAAIVAGMGEDSIRQLAAGGAAIFAVLDPKQTVVTLQNIGSESVKSVAEITKLIPTITKRIADLTATVTGLNTKVTARSAEINKDLLSKGANPFSVKAEAEKLLTADPVTAAIQKEIIAITAEINCLKAELQEAEILLEYGKYIDLSCGYMVQAIQETSALANAAKEALAKVDNAANAND